MFHKLFQLKTPAKLSFRPRTEVVTEGLSLYVMFFFFAVVFLTVSLALWPTTVSGLCLWKLFSFTVYMSDMSDVHVHCWSAA